ncbi:MAG: Ig-like domain-containing protein, partial [Prevotellaceae bacterium]|nr:Ig-like domain-containing protein [Prevotellaceae bacterium]
MSRVTKMKNYLLPLAVAAGLSAACCGVAATPPPPAVAEFKLDEIRIGSEANRDAYVNVSLGDTVKLTFSEKVDVGSIADNIVLKQEGKTIPVAVAHDDNPTLKINLSGLQSYTGYVLTVNAGLKSESGVAMLAGKNFSVATGDDMLDKFERISNDSLLTLVQRQTFR